MSNVGGGGHRTEIVAHAFTVLFGRGIIRLSQFVAFLIFARMMSSAEFGWFGILTTAMTLAATIGSLGLRQSIAYEVGQRRLSVGEALGTAFALWPALAVLSSGVVFLLYGRALPGISQAQAGCIILTGVGGAILLMLSQGKYLGVGAIKAFSLSESIPRVTLLVAAVALFFADRVELSTSLWAHVLGYVVVLPVAAWLAFRGVGRLRFMARQLAGMLRYGLLFAFNLLLITLCSRISMFVIERVHGASAAGEFFAAVRVNEIFLEIATAFGMVLFSNATRREKGNSVLRRNARIACWMFWLFVLLGVAVAAVAPLILVALIGQQYASAGTALQLLSLGLAPAAASKVIYPSLAGSGHPGFGTPVIAICLVTNVVLAALLVPSMSVNGGVIAVVVGQYVLFAGYLLTCRIRFGIRFRAFLVPEARDAKALIEVASARVRRGRERV